MLDTIRVCKDLGCEGIVSGALTKEGGIDSEFTSKLIDATGEMIFTFHRAFDVCIDPLKSLEKLISLGVDRLLTSGQELTARSGLPLLKSLMSSSKNNIQIMPGSGIDTTDVLIFKESGFPAIHLSAIPKTAEAHSFFESGLEGTSSLEIITQVVALAKGEPFGGPPGSDLDD